jgi:hypothetical protein
MPGRRVEARRFDEPGEPAPFLERRRQASDRMRGCAGKARRRRLGRRVDKAVQFCKE